MNHVIRDRLHKQVYAPLSELVERRVLHRRTPFSMEIHYRKNQRSELAHLCDRYGTDKGQVDAGKHEHPWPAHTYTDFYEMLFQPRRNTVEVVVECGIGTNTAAFVTPFADVDHLWSQPGGSLRVWRDYFPHADIVGVDIDKEVLFTDERIRTYYCDQTDPHSVADFRADAKLPAGSVDIVIDDGLHEFHAGRCLFDNAFDLLKPGGVWVIEDVNMRDRASYDHYLAGRSDIPTFQIVRLRRRGLPMLDNSLIVIQKN